MMNRIISLIIFALLFLSTAKLYPQTWKELNNTGIEYYEKSSYEKAIEYFEKAVKQAEKEFGVYHENYDFSSQYLGFTYLNIGNFLKAEQCFKRIIDIRKRTFGEDNLAYASALSFLSTLYDEYQEFTKEIPLRLTILKIMKEKLGESDPEYAKSLEDLEDLYMEMGAYTKAERLCQELVKIKKEHPGETQEDYASALNRLALVYGHIGKYSEAEGLYMESMKIRKEELGENHPDYASSLNNLGLLYNDMHKYKEAIPLLNEALKITKDNEGENNTAYATYLDNIATSYNRLGDFEKAEPLYLEAMRIRKEKLGVSHPDYASSLNNLSAMYGRTGDYSKAESLIIESLKILKEEHGNKHPKYTQSLMNLAVIYLETEKYTKAFELFKEINNNYINYLNDNFAFLSESEKVKFLKTIDFNFEVFYSFTLNYFEQNPEIAADMLEVRMSTKGIVLSSNTRLHSIISKSGNPELENLFGKLSDLKSEILKSSSLSIQEQQKRGINTAQLENEANETEKELSRRSEFFRQIYEDKNVSFTDIQNALAPNEAAIEFVDFRYWKTKWSDTTFYIAFVTTRGQKNPVLVKLCSLDELSKVLSVNADNENSYANNQQTSNELYKLVWEPLEKYLKGIDKIYLSPSGLLNKVSFASLNTGGNSLLIDKHNIRYTGNIKDIIRIKKEEKNTDFANHKAVLFGGLMYDVDESTMRKNADTYKENNDKGELREESSITQELRGNRKWGYLKGTLAEVEKLKAILAGNKLNVTEYTGDKGIEEVFKSLSGKKAPYILHVATHGFFNPEPDKEYVNPESSKKDNIYKISDNPLIRSGLILAGANNVWSSGIEIDGVENGILTAYEVSNMDLSNTELVVLSACETGLGDIKGGEGVYGLQRAFKTAGAKSIIMSLWKVPDKATVELMEMFYTNWLEKKMPKEDAFNLAQSEMRKKFSNPYMWAAFILQ